MRKMGIREVRKCAPYLFFSRKKLIYDLSLSLSLLSFLSIIIISVKMGTRHENRVRGLKKTNDDDCAVRAGRTGSAKIKDRVYNAESTLCCAFNVNTGSELYGVVWSRETKRRGNRGQREQQLKSFGMFRAPASVKRPDPLYPRILLESPLLFILFHFFFFHSSSSLSFRCVEFPDRSLARALSLRLSPPSRSFLAMHT